MKAASILALLAVVCFVDASHLLAGNVADRVVLQIHEKVEYNAIPFIKRVKQKFYTVEPKKIQGIQALDQLQGHASVNVTAGGVGHSFVNLRFKSDRGSGLDYDVGIYDVVPPTVTDEDPSRTLVCTVIVGDLCRVLQAGLTLNGIQSLNHNRNH